MRPNFPLIAEAHKRRVRDRFRFPLIADTHMRQANRPDLTDMGLDSFQFMRLNDEQQVIRDCA
jgi:aryl carrier-like protein